MRLKEGTINTYPEVKEVNKTVQGKLEYMLTLPTYNQVVQSVWMETRLFSLYPRLVESHTDDYH